MTNLFQWAASLSEADGEKPLPVDTWNPQHCGRMDLVIKTDGTWWHEGKMITRPALVRLFSRILRRDPDGYVLVTPVEKISIEVEDVPFLAVDYDRVDDDWIFKTNVGDRVRLEAEHPLVLRDSEALGQLIPYIRVRHDLEARIDRPVYYRMVNDAALADDERSLIIHSAGRHFTLPLDPDQ